MAIRPYAENAAPERGRAAVASEHAQQVVGGDLVGDQGTAAFSMSGQCVITLFRLTRLRTRSSTAPYVPVSTPGIVARQNRWSSMAVCCYAFFKGCWPDSAQPMPGPSYRWGGMTPHSP